MATQKTIKNVFQDQLSLNAGQKFCRKLQGENSAILLTVKLPFVIKIIVVFTMNGLTGCLIKQTYKWVRSKLGLFHLLMPFLAEKLLLALKEFNQRKKIIFRPK